MMGKAKLLLYGIFLLIVWNAVAMPTCAQDAASQNTPSQAGRALGTVTAVNGQLITLKTDVGTELSVTVAETTRLLQLKPGEKDLKQATPLALADLKAGDRVLVRGVASSDGKSLQASSVIAMKQSDIADKQARDRAEWQRSGVGGLVKNVDAASGNITISTSASGTQKEVIVHTTNQTIARRYAADSIKFDDAKAAPITEIKAGDQLRARGQKNTEGTEISADEVVSGTFRSIAGILISSDTTSGTIIVTDLATKQPVTLRIASDSQLRKLQPFVAQAIAARLKGTPTGGAAGPNGAAGAPPAQKPAGSNSPAASGPASGSGGGGTGPFGSGPGAGFGQGSGGQGRGGDFQQMIARMPAASASDLNKGDALMIVATAGSPTTSSTVITLLAGVEPILQASSKATPDMILSPWSLGTGGGGEGATP